MKTTQTPRQRQKARRDRLRIAGITRMTVEMDKTTAQILRSLAAEHGRTHAEVIQLGIKLARNALRDDGGSQAPRSASPIPAAPTGALAALTAQLDELKAAQVDDLPPVSVAEARAARLGLTGEVRT
ncbi:hypothetical protein SAMN05444064_10379 [Pseudomonas syringae]|uniref:hypothetical protein n=1 Tax=Pseudomonas syringae TaxID=317 RepID=UPI0008990EDF|nr:hypothetical protein [Pseudomonas syringae]SDW36784.1 hypothetical protein SAMN05444514_10379 [Pseudomonas syringae]SFL65306.1 hypothetical protein SAMN05444064_10379 [Pseudomonas syringae]